jgi:hypothetical protein
MGQGRIVNNIGRPESPCQTVKKQKLSKRAAVEK